MTRRVAGLLLTLIAVVVSISTVVAYVFFFPSGVKWPSGPIVMHLQLGPSGRALTDGAADWGEAAEFALALWNPHIATGQFQVVRASTTGRDSRNGVNNVFFDDTIYGDRFGSTTLAVTLSYRLGSQIVESDVIFNTAVSFDSYRGALRRPIDFRRVAVHEFGHVLGLGHPDEGGQSRASVMNSIVSNIEVPEADDTSGVRALYGDPSPPPAPTPTPAPVPTPLPPETGDFPPRDQTLDFRQRLEIKYRDGLHRSPAPSFVDLEGGAVSTMADFPPRNDSFDFRMRLETKYRDDLRRDASSTAVDLEGEVVWTQEYLRYRLGRCSHQAAVDRVFAQIDGAGVQPVCST
jgi:hypothetical protein